MNKQETDVDKQIDVLSSNTQTPDHCQGLFIVPLGLGKRRKMNKIFSPPIPRHQTVFTVCLLALWFIALDLIRHPAKHQMERTDEVSPNTCSSMSSLMGGLELATAGSPDPCKAEGSHNCEREGDPLCMGGSGIPVCPRAKPLTLAISVGPPNVVVHLK